MAQHLTLVGLSEDRSKLLLVDDAGVEFTLDVDAKLRAALRGEHARIGQLEIEMDSVLRPRDIQARIRGGETPETVAAAAKTTVDKIMAFAAPVLAEREHVAQRAQRSSLRRRGSDADGPARNRTLGEAVSSHLRALNVSPDIVSWDAYRREDGRWALTGDFETGARKGAARFAFDAPGNFVVTENDDARWLIGDMPDPPRAAAPTAAPPARRLSAVPSDELPLGDDAIELVRPGPAPPATHEAGEAREPDETSELPPVRTVDLTDTAAKVRAVPPPEQSPPARRPRRGASRRAPEEPSFLDSVLQEDPAVQQDREDPTPESSQELTAEPTGEPPAGEPAPAEPPKRPARKKGARASVPSWDEIMFGGGKSD